jgi:hypothetical protein
MTAGLYLGPLPLPMLGFGGASVIPVTPPATALRIWIGGEDLTARYQPGTLQIRTQLQGRSSASLRLVDRTGASSRAFDVAIGESVLVENAAGVLFGGLVDSITDTIPGAISAPCVILDLALAGWGELADRHIVTRLWEDSADPPTQTAGDIVRELLEDYLAADSVSEGTIEDGPVVARFPAAYATVAECLDRLSELTAGAYTWRIDALRQLHFHARASFECPVELTPSSAPVVSLTLRRSRSGYRNVQYVTGGDGTTGDRVETFIADGEEQTWTLALPLADKPTIKIDGAPVDPADIGIREVDATDWVYQLGEERVGVNTDSDVGATIPSVGDEIEITYRGLYPLVTLREAATEIAARAAVEGTSGRYETVDTDSSIETADEARDKAASLLSRFARLPRRIAFELDASGVVEGQLIAVTLPEYRLAADTFLIESVTYRDLGGEMSDSKIRAVCDATDAADAGAHLAWLREFILGRKPFRASENAVVDTPVLQEEQVFAGDSVAATEADDLDPWSDDPYTVWLVGSTSRLARSLVLEGAPRILGPRIGWPEEI